MKKHGYISKLFLIFVIFILVSNKLYSQYDLFQPNYALLRWEADSLYKKRDFKNAAILFEKAGNLNSASIFKWVAYLNASKCYFEVKDIKKSFSTYQKSAKYGLRYVSISQFEKDTLNFLFRKFKGWKKTANKIEKNIKNFSNIDKELQNKLKNLYEKDQKYRNLSVNLKTKDKKYRDSIINIYGKTFVDSLIPNKIREQDLLNQQEFKEILRKYGWPGLKLVGYDGDQAAWLIVQHADQDIKFQKYCLKMIIKGLREQNTRLKNYPYLLDRLRVNEGKTQFFGTQFNEIKDSKNRSVDLRPHTLQDLKMANKIRHCFGLETLEEYLDYAKNRYNIKASN